MKKSTTIRAPLSRPRSAMVGGLGALFALAGFLLPVFPAAPPWSVTLCESLALICLIIYLSGHWKSLQTFSTRRSTRMGITSIIAVLLFIGILTILNFLVIRHGGRWDLSESQRFSLSPQTYEVLNGLTEPVNVTVFSHERSPGFSAYRDLLEGYAHASGYLTVEFVDPERSPNRAREYDISRMDEAVFQNGSHKIHVSRPTEMELTSALLRVTKQDQKRIIFLAGHGERDTGNRGRQGFSLVKTGLEKQGYQVEEGSLMGENISFQNISVLVIANPQDPLTPQEQKNLMRFIESGGRLLLLLDPHPPLGFAPILSQWGIALDTGIVVDPQDRIAQGNPTALQIRTFTDHPITHELTIPVLLPVSRRIVFDPHKGTDWEFTPLVHTSDKSWVEMNVNNTSPVYHPGEDIEGPLILAGALEPKNTISDNHPPSPAIVIVGNSAFAMNAYLNFPGNLDFFLHTMAWLARENQLLSIAPKDPALRPFIPNPTQEQMLLALQVFSLPVLFLIFGLTIWRRRRHL